MSEPELLLDSNIRLWVVLPIVFITFFVGMIRHYVSILLQSDKRLTQEQVSDRSGPGTDALSALSHLLPFLSPRVPPPPLTPPLSFAAKSWFGAGFCGRMENTSRSRYGGAWAALVSQWDSPEAGLGPPLLPPWRCRLAWHTAMKPASKAPCLTSGDRPAGIENSGEWGSRLLLFAPLLPNPCIVKAVVRGGGVELSDVWYWCWDNRSFAQSLKGGFFLRAFLGLFQEF